MKTKLTLLGSLAYFGVVASLSAQSAVTAPVGYRTQTIKAGVFNLISTNFSNAVVAAGALEGADATTATHVGAFAGLEDGTAYTLKITSGANAGRSAQVTGATDDVLTVDADLGAAAGDTYEVRATQTLGGVFGANNEAGLTEGTAETADIVWIPTAAGFNRRYYNGTDWKNAAGPFLTFENDPIPFDVGIFVQSRAATDLDIVFVGHVQTSVTTFDTAPNGFAFRSRVFPVGQTLGESGLADTLATGTVDVADIVWNPDGAGGYNRRYFNGTNWKNAAGPFLTFDDDILESGFLVQNQDGVAGSGTLVIPDSFDLDGGGN